MALIDFELYDKVAEWHWLTELVLTVLAMRPFYGPEWPTPPAFSCKFINTNSIYFILLGAPESSLDLHQ